MAFMSFMKLFSEQIKTMNDDTHPLCVGPPCEVAYVVKDEEMAYRVGQNERTVKFLPRCM